MRTYREKNSGFNVENIQLRPLDLECIKKHFSCDLKGIIQHEVLKYGQTVTAQVYCDQLDRLNAALREKRPRLVNRGDVVLQHDNARPHVAELTRKKIEDLGWTNFIASSLFSGHRPIRLPPFPFHGTLF